MAYAFSIATLSTTGSEEVKVIKYFGNFSAILRPFTNKYQNLPSHFDKTDKSQNGFRGYSLKKVLIDIHERVADRGKIECQLHLDYFFEFCKT